MSQYIEIYKVTRSFAFSTTTPLGAAGVYISPTFDVISYKQARGSVNSDQAGTFIYQHSDDGVTWYNPTSVSAAANAFTSVSVSFAGKYFRITYTNGATPQTSFHLSTYLEPI